MFDLSMSNTSHLVAVMRVSLSLRPSRKMNGVYAYVPYKMSTSDAKSDSAMEKPETAVAAMCSLARCNAVREPDLMAA